MDGTGSGLCPVLSFDFSGVEILGSNIKELVIH
jgi:hypothetical protein